MSNDARHELGRLGEQLAVDHLTRRGFHILARNFRTRHGELDIVARFPDGAVKISNFASMGDETTQG